MGWEIGLNLFRPRAEAVLHWRVLRVSTNSLEWVSLLAVKWNEGCYSGYLKGPVALQIVEQDIYTPLQNNTVPGMQPGTPWPPMEGAKGCIPGTHSTLRTPAALSPHHLCKYSFLPSLVLTKNWGSFKAVSQIDSRLLLLNIQETCFFFTCGGFTEDFCSVEWSFLKLFQTHKIYQGPHEPRLALRGYFSQFSSISFLLLSPPPSFLLFLFLLPPRHQAFLFLFFLKTALLSRI